MVFTFVTFVVFVNRRGLFPLMLHGHTYTILLCKVQRQVIGTMFIQEYTRISIEIRGQ